MRKASFLMRRIDKSWYWNSI